MICVTTLAGESVWLSALHITEVRAVSSGSQIWLHQTSDEGVLIMAKEFASDVAAAVTEALRACVNTR